MRAIVSGLIFLAIFGALLVLLYHFEVLARAIAILGIGFLVLIIVLVAVTGIVLIVAVPYYLITKKPKVEEGSYRLEDEKGK